MTPKGTELHWGSAPHSQLYWKWRILYFLREGVEHSSPQKNERPAWQKLKIPVCKIIIGR